MAYVEYVVKDNRLFNLESKYQFEDLLRLIESVQKAEAVENINLTDDSPFVGRLQKNDFIFDKDMLKLQIVNQANDFKDARMNYDSNNNFDNKNNESNNTYKNNYNSNNKEVSFNFNNNLEINNKSTINILNNSLNKNMPFSPSKIKMREIYNAENYMVIDEDKNANKKDLSRKNNENTDLEKTWYILRN